MHYCIFIFLCIPSDHTPRALCTSPHATRPAHFAHPLKVHIPFRLCALHFAHPVQAVRLAYPVRLTEHKSFFRCWMKANIRKNSFALSEYSLFAIDKANFVNLYSFFPLTKSYYSAILYK